MAGGAVRTRLSEFSLVVQVIRAELPLTLPACTFEISGAAQSTLALVSWGTLVPPDPSSASMYSTLMVSPAETDRIPSPFTGGTAETVIVP